MNLKLKVKILKHYPSQIAFAQEVGIDGSELSKIVRGWRVLKPEIKETIAQKLRCKPDEIFPAAH